MDKIYKIHFLGIGGISLSAMAKITKSYGHFVSGSDRIASEITKDLEKKGIPVCVDGISSFIDGCDFIVRSAAIHDDDRELIKAKNLNKPIIERADMLGKIAKQYKNVISVAGSHGKTTTTAMISKIFIDAKKDPTVHIGGTLDFIDKNVRVGGKDFFITEACEYVDSFLSLESDVSVVLNIQKDHLDYFKNLRNLKKSFRKFTLNTKKKGLVVYCSDDKNINFKINRRSVCYSINGDGLIAAKNIKEYERGKYKFDCYFLDQKLMNVKLGVYGKHNILNALAAISVALNYGIDKKIIKSSLLNFTLVKRRFEDYGVVNGVKIIHDYAHHPTEIEAVIKVAKSITKKDIFVVFQPHTYSRTKALLKEFSNCFFGIKEVCVYKVYAAREKPSEGINEKQLSEAINIQGQKAAPFNDYKKMKKYLLGKTKEGDMVLILGAGDIESFASYFKSQEN